ncbi:retrovirus-related Pol polyprotein from transposon 412 [Trichonephila clavata]|uniref:Retrovirus-related Pol polyprotein from transposon 412 n=1 Tax=Trichonephila clavata TaxID=2740835 RepID=A0A8X6GF75_TRICU|nr:retrovirus-related Pol polyprotein from transposon 412 [Trichonephila clavata]
MDKSNNAFNKLTDARTSAPVLSYPETGRQFILDRDASHESFGAVLSQEIDDQERVITCFSKCLSKSERNYCVTRKELLAIIKAVEHFHPYLYGRRFLLQTDHASLIRTLNFKNPESQIARWIRRLQDMNQKADKLLNIPMNFAVVGTIRENKQEIPPELFELRSRSVGTSMYWFDQAT